MKNKVLKLGFWVVSMLFIVVVMFCPIPLMIYRDNDWLALGLIFTIPIGLVLLLFAFAIYTLIIEVDY